MLMGHSSIRRVRKHFADQFEAEGDGYLYRRFSKGSPIRVSAEERDRFVDAFDRTLRRAIWITLGAGIMLGIALAVVGGVSGFEVPDWAASVLMALVVGGLFAHGWRVYTAPTHDLRHRLPVGRERTGAEMQRVALARLSYVQLAIGAAAAVLVIVLKFAEWPTTSGKLWLGFAVAMLAVFFVQGWRKWRFAREAERAP